MTGDRRIPRALLASVARGHVARSAVVNWTVPCHMLLLGVVACTETPRNFAERPAPETDAAPEVRDVASRPAEEATNDASVAETSGTRPSGADSPRTHEDVGAVPNAGIESDASSSPDTPAGGGNQTERCSGSECEPPPDPCVLDQALLDACQLAP